MSDRKVREAATGGMQDQPRPAPVPRRCSVASQLLRVYLRGSRGRQRRASAGEQAPASKRRPWRQR
eukprot:scaffold4402_cov338-Prasinococcus_capsulatus_cf.AAC.1